MFTKIATKTQPEPYVLTTFEELMPGRLKKGGKGEFKSCSEGTKS
jgi:hypothetical protein